MTPADRLARDDVSTDPFDWFEMGGTQQEPNDGRSQAEGKSAPAGDLRSDSLRPVMLMGKNLPDPSDQKRARFVGEYLKDLNGTQAAIRAGYSEATARQQATRLLADVHIALEIERAYAARAARTQVDADMVVTELARIAFSDVWNYTTGEDGKLQLAGDAPEDATRAVAAVKEKTRWIPSGDGGEPIKERTVEFKLWDKNSALEKLGKHLGMFETVPQAWVRERLRRTVALFERLPVAERAGLLSELRAIWN